LGSSDCRAIEKYVRDMGEGLKSWQKINEKMWEIKFPEFISLDTFWDISDIVRKHVYQD